MSLRVLSATFLLIIMTGCSLPSLSLPKLSLPRLFKVTVQQGNVLTQEMVDQLKPGMTRSQVAFIMGEPILRNTFNEDRWDYVYTVELPGYFSQDVRMSLFFENEALAYFTGDFVPGDVNPEAEAEDVASTETVPDDSG